MKTLQEVSPLHLKIVDIIYEVAMTDKRPWTAHELASAICKVVGEKEVTFSQSIRNKSFDDHEFKGKTYKSSRDQTRLATQGKKVLAFMKDGLWHTKAEINNATGAPEHSISARFSDIKDLGFGQIEREYIRNGLHKYRFIPS